MGVNNLWFILEPAKRTENLSALRNKTLCVDLSGWICEAQCAKGLKNNVNKPHLRNLFFRLLHLTRLGVKLVFVVDGKPPELKWDAIAKRVQARDGGQFCKVKKPAKASAGSGARVGRSQFAIWVREVRSSFFYVFIFFTRSLSVLCLNVSYARTQNWRDFYITWDQAWLTVFGY